MKGMVVSIAFIGERNGTYRVLVGKPEGNAPLGGPRCRWHNHFMIDLQEGGLGGGQGLD
jgi:hypothetical protein